MDLHVNLVGRKDLSGEIYRQLRQAIAEGWLGVGDALPPTRHLARRLSVSRMTVTVAYDRLAAEGFVTARAGAGTFVSEHAAPRGSPAKQLEGSVLRPRAVWQSVPLSTAFDRPARYDFRTGLPDASLFPHRTWRRLMTRAMRSSEVAAGVYQHPAGNAQLRAAIARHIAISRGVRTAAEAVTVTNGTQQALDILARVLLTTGDQIAVEDPGYQPARWLFESLGIRALGVPVDRDGLVVTAIPRRVRAVYVTPSHQYPLGVPMTLARRQALLSWAERHEAAIIEDDYDAEFRYGGRPLEALHALDGSGRVIYVGSFSKTMLPTLRVGFIVSPPSLCSAVHKAKYVSDWHTSGLVQAALARFIEDGSYARHIRRVGTVYRARHELIVSILRRDFKQHLELVPSSTGLHVTALARRLPAARIASTAQRAADLDVAVQVLSSFTIDRVQQAGVMLGYGAIATDDIEEGLRRLRLCFRH
jgi:GntR family transcriptional regulator/MocR family aminotransferase